MSIINFVGFHLGIEIPWIPADLPKMRQFLILSFGFSFLVLTFNLWSASDHEVRAIANQLRCPVCRGIPIAESPSELAQDMMQVIRQKLDEGLTEEQILEYFVDRYGEWILLKPKPKGINLALWIFPFIVLVGGGGLLAFAVSRWTRR